MSKIQLSCEGVRRPPAYLLLLSGAPLPPSLLMSLRSFDLCTPLFRLPRCQGKSASSELSSARASSAASPSGSASWTTRISPVLHHQASLSPHSAPGNKGPSKWAPAPSATVGVCEVAGSGPVPGLSSARGGPRSCLPPTAVRGPWGRRPRRTLGSPPEGWGLPLAEGTEPGRSRLGEPAQPNCRAGMDLRFRGSGSC